MNYIEEWGQLMPIEGLEQIRKITKNLQNRRLVRDVTEPSLKEAVKTLHKSVTSELPPSERPGIERMRRGIRGSTRFGLRPGVLRRGLSRGFKRFTKELKEKFSKAVFE